VTTFFYDFNSPYAYLSAHRVDEVLPGPVTWRPIAFRALIRQVGKTPWSLLPGREAGMRECEARAAAAGLPLRWPAGWPDANYSIVVLRAAVVAEAAGRLREFSLAAFARGLGAGGDLSQLPVVLEVVAEAGLEPAAVAAGVERPEVKAELRARTDAAIAAGVTGVPTVLLDDGRLFWGDDRLADAAAALA
jgi:2-hydroxychromene-2-carboxylate isomerase